EDKKSWINIPPWIIIGAVVILAPIFFYIAVEGINKQKEYTERLLLERGTALIRSFEAGTRTGLLGMRWDGAQIQKLVTETAQQPDVDYLLVTDQNGKILAHSDPSKVGQVYWVQLDTEKIYGSNTPDWRQFEGEDSEKVFEVYGKTSPLPGQLTAFVRTDSPHELLRLRISSQEGEDLSRPIVFVGLDMGPLESARKADARNTIILALILLLIGFAGIISLFLAHGYRTARASLSIIKAFSDTLVENLPMGILAIGTDGKITSFNQAAETLLKYSTQEAVGKEAESVLPESLRTIVDELDSGDEILSRAIDCARSDGKIVPLEVTATILRGDEGDSLGDVLLFRDLTEIRKLRREVERSQRLASLGRLAAGIAHEIRNPLSSIKGFATYFRQRYNDVPEDQETAEIMVQEVDRLNRVIGELLEFARPMDMQLRKTAIRDLIQSSLKMVEAQAREKNIEIKTTIAPEIDTVLLDPDRMNQIFLNLYLNAIQAMDEGGVLTADLSRDGVKKIKIVISDTGKGIARKDLGKVFDPYYTTKPSGTGLGLAIVHRIVEAHQGEIKVESKEGKGTTVTIVLPA
ncbi:MAG: PAS domain S-box protein, partial [Deltaproteobacteria bacterium]|nr:PAS domain S-box protein [Deltaproteobacteria bacterium]